MTAFNAPSGTIWQYVFIVGPNSCEETLFLVLPACKTVYTGTTQYRVRQYLDLLTGEHEWFAESSALDQRSEMFG